MTARTCTNPKCGAVGQLRRGLCNKCRLRMRKHGSLDDPAPVTHCPESHEYTPENTYTDPAGKRHCRICGRGANNRSRKARVWPKCKEDCPRDTKGGAMDWCASHYGRFRKYGHPFGGPEIRRWRVPMAEQIAARKAYGRDYQALHRARLLDKRKVWRAANPDLAKALARSRAAFWRATHPDAIRFPGVPDADRVDYMAILEQHGMVCHICRKDIGSWDDLHFDHVIPLARGGPHSQDNVLPAHALCNHRKKDKLMSELTFI